MSDCKDADGNWVESPIHGWFGLTYSSYLVLHRSIMEAMPLDWQEKMVALLEQAEDIVDNEILPSGFMVRAKKNGKFIKDPWANYRHPPEIPFKKGLTQPP